LLTTIPISKKQSSLRNFFKKKKKGRNKNFLNINLNG
jgi:hypothetical protein